MTHFAEFDAERGVWVGDTAAGAKFEHSDDFLYIFGYGSLVWRPGDLMEKVGSKSKHLKNSFLLVFASFADELAPLQHSYYVNHIRVVPVLSS